MSIANYADLQAAVGNWLNRADLSERIPEFIALAEARMNRDKRLRTVDSTYRGTLTVSSQFTSLPSDFASMVNLEYQGDTVVPLEYQTPQQMDRWRSYCTSGDPRWYCIHGNELEVVPVQSEAVSLGIIYRRRITALSSSSTTNWLLDVAPDIYLYATLQESAPYLLHDERIGAWSALYNERCEAYDMSSQHDELGSDPLVLRGERIGP